MKVNLFRPKSCADAAPPESLVAMLNNLICSGVITTLQKETILAGHAEPCHELWAHPYLRGGLHAWTRAIIDDSRGQL